MIEGLYQRFVFDDAATGSVDEEGARAEGTNIVPIDEVVGMLIVGHVEGDDVRLAEDLFERSIFEMEYLREKNVFLSIKGDDVHPKAFGDADDVESDMTSTDYPKRLVLQIESHEALNRVVSLLTTGIGFVYIARKCQTEGKGMLSDGILSVVGHIGYRHLVGVTGRDIDMIKAR